jgi:hypothetical protein
MLKILVRLALVSIISAAPAAATECVDGYLFSSGDGRVQLSDMVAIGSFGTYITRSEQGWSLQTGTLDVTTRSKSVSIVSGAGTSVVPPWSKASFHQGLESRPQDPAPQAVSADQLKMRLVQHSRAARLSNRPVRMVLKQHTDFEMVEPYRLKFQRGAALIDAPSGIVIDTIAGTVQAPPGSTFVLSSSFSGVRVLACRELLSPIRFLLPAKQVLINDSEELFVCNHRPMPFEVTPDDGIGRKAITLTDLGDGGTAVTCQFSIPTMMRSASYFGTWTKAAGRTSQLRGDLLKSAAAVSFARSSPQPFYVAPRLHH